MTSRAWLDGRRPTPPGDLRAAVRESLSDSASPADVEGLRDAAVERLGKARGAPGRVRESAFDLLAADALITYACEAALESDDPEAVLASLLTIGAAS